MKERIIKYFTEELDQDERIELLCKIEKEPNLKKEYTLYRNIRGLLSFVSHPDDKKYGHQKYDQFIAKNKKKSKRKLYRQIINYAAVVALLIMGSWIGSYFYHQGEITQEITYNTLSAPAGQRASVILSDGTEVWLNARSRIKYPSHFMGDMRKVELSGEAFFSVTSNKDKPFIVSTSSIDVKVLGTVFNVRENQLDSSVDVGLLEGAVDVCLSGNKPSKISLKPMQNLNYANGKIILSDFTDENDFLWREETFNFENVALFDICKKLEWYYDIKIVINNPTIKSYSCTGKFRQQNGPSEILRIIQRMHKFKMKKDDINNIISLS